MTGADERASWLSRETQSMWAVDWEKGEVTLVLQSGEKHVEQLLQHAPRPSAEIAFTAFDWDRWWLWTKTAKGHLILSEVWSPVGDAGKGRPSVYLDQNHWSTLARSIYRPHSLAPEVFRAAERIRSLALDGGIRLPISSATMQETSRLHSDQRYEVGITVASLSAGWQLRDPVDVRRRELVERFGRRFGRESRGFPEIVTLAPQGIFGDRISAYEMPDASSSVQQFLAALTWPSVITGMLLDPEAIKGVPPTTWAGANERLSRSISSLPTPARDAATSIAAVRDAEGLIAEAFDLLHLTPTEVASLERRDLIEAVESPPFSGLFSAVIADRLRDARRRWHPNDLNDVMFLTCAAAYCDYVVAERSTGRAIQAVDRRHRRPSTVFTTLPEVVAALDRAGVRTATQRANETDGSELR